MSETISSDYSSKVWEQYGVEKEEDRPKASSFASEESIFTESNYDRTKTERDVIINYQTKPDDKDSKATYLDIDKYYDEYHVSNKDTYFDDVALQYMTDIAAYFGVDLNDEDSLEKMADIYEQIAEKNNMTTKRSNYTNVEDYIVACNTEIAKRSWNGTLDDDFIDLTGVSTDKKAEDDADGDDSTTVLPDGWTQNDDGTFTTADGKTVEAIDYEDLEKNGYSVNDDGKIIDKDGKEVRRTVTFQKDTDDNGVEDDVTSYYAYVDEAESTDDASDDDTTTDTSSSKAITELIDSGISGDSDIIKMLEADDNLTVETTADGYKIGDTVFDKTGKNKIKVF